MEVAGKGPPPVVMIPTIPQNKLLRSHINYCTSFCAKFGYYLLYTHYKGPAKARPVVNTYRYNYTWSTLCAGKPKVHRLLIKLTLMIQN